MMVHDFCAHAWYLAVQMKLVVRVCYTMQLQEQCVHSACKLLLEVSEL